MIKKVIITLSLIIMLLSCQVAFADSTIIPKPPSWVQADEYLIFQGSTAYNIENWTLLMELRNLAESGDKGDSQEFLKRWEVLFEGKDPGVLFELALIHYKTAANGDKVARSALLYEALKKVLPDDPNYLPLEIWYMRAMAWPRAGHSLIIDGLKSELSKIVDHPDYNLDKILQHKDFDKMRNNPKFSLLYDPYFFLDDRYIPFNTTVVSRNNRTLVPIRIVVEMLGGQIEWDGVTKSTTIKRGSKIIILTINNDLAVVNGKSTKLDIAPILFDGRTMLPLRFVAENLDQVVEYNPENKVVTIRENIAFEKGKNMRSWMLGACAIIAVANGGDPYAIGMEERSEYTSNTARSILLNSWSCESKEDIQLQILFLLAGGHNQSFEADAKLFKGLSEQALNEFISREDESTKHMYKYVLALSDKWNSKGIKAWDLYRVCHLASWGYMGGYLDLKEAYFLAEPAMKELRKTFSSWDEATENYLDGYAYWSRTDITKEGTKYRQRVSIYETLKRMQETNGDLFDNSVWSQPVSGVYE